ncbi:MAG: hypothetical protein M1838_004866 [Thelocarpon superellum]|nr:MAG: hypothetical protein M1838_004866 [Thelocarpon superellum]
MSTTAKKLPASSSGTPRPSNASSPAPRAPSRPSTPSTLSNNGLARSRSVRGSTSGTPLSAKAAAKRPGTGTPSLSTAGNGAEGWSEVDADDARAQTAAVIDDLKTRLQSAELASEELKKHLAVCQSRLDEALAEQGKLEDRLHDKDGKIESLASEKRELAKQRRETERIYEAERVSMMQERHEMSRREEELVEGANRLKDKLAHRDLRDSDDGHRLLKNDDALSALEGNHFAPPASPPLNAARHVPDIETQAQIIESLRLEVADAHIKLLESENMGGGRVQELERVLLETRMTNARLMEDNESFQLLLSEKTLNGDFSKGDLMQRSLSPEVPEENASPDRGFGASLADELESADEHETDNYRRLEGEVKAAKDQNKALTLYINNIIERLLQHKEFEAILDKTGNLLAGPGAASRRRSQGGNTDKDLPPPPPPEASGQSVLQRAKSVAMSGNRSRPRPLSTMGPPSRILSPTDDLSTAPRIPLGRSQSVRGGAPRRFSSDLSNPAQVVGQMYRGQGSGSRPMSPGTPSTRPSMFSPPLHQGNPNAAARIPSGSRPMTSERRDSRGALSPHGDDHHDGSNGLPSPPQTSGTQSSSSASIAGNKLRPLRLVQATTEEAPPERGRLGDITNYFSSGGAAFTSTSSDSDAVKKAKRGSWMGWFNKGAGGGNPGSESGASNTPPATNTTTTTMKGGDFFSKFNVNSAGLASSMTGTGSGSSSTAPITPNHAHIPNPPISTTTPTASATNPSPSPSPSTGAEAEPNANQGLSEE